MASIRTTVILKTDIVDSTPRTAAQTQAEMGFQRKQHQRLISDTASKNHGSIFEEEGDAYWMEFPSVTTAALAAIDMHQTLRAQQMGKGEKGRLAIRAVITVGDVLYQENDAIGTVMALTARIEKITPPDEIYLSHAAWLILNKAELQTSFVNEFPLKGFTEPERIYKVDQKFRTRILTDQYIVFTDAKGFTKYVRSMDTEHVENFLLQYDDMINDICGKFSGVIRQVNGDQYFLTFSDCTQTLAALEELCQNWKDMIERYGTGISIGVHKGSLNVIRSYVYSDDIHTTLYLSGINSVYDHVLSEIWVVGSRKIIDELKGTYWDERFQELDPGKSTQEFHKMVFREHGAYRLLLG